MTFRGLCNQFIDLFDGAVMWLILKALDNKASGEGEK